MLCMALVWCRNPASKLLPWMLFASATLFRFWISESRREMDFCVRCKTCVWCSKPSCSPYISLLFFAQLAVAATSLGERGTGYPVLSLCRLACAGLSCVREVTIFDRMLDMSRFRLSICCAIWTSFLRLEDLFCTISREILPASSEMSTESDCLYSGSFACEICMSTVCPVRSRFRLYRLSMSPSTVTVGTPGIVGATSMPKLRPCL